MNKLFGLFLLALACWAPSSADAANRFLTCSTTCTLDASNTAIWGSTSGGTGASVPGSSDDVILDAATCVGGTTCTATFGSGYNPTWISLTMSACTASTSGCILDANTNGNTITLTSASGATYTNTGAGTRTLSGGTWLLSGSQSVSWNMGTSATVTNSPSVSYTGGSANRSRSFTGGGKTYGTLTINSPSGGSSFISDAGNTFNTVTISAPNKIFWGATGGGGTNTIGTLTNISGSSSSLTLFMPQSLTFPPTTLSSANNWTCDWCAISQMTFTGGGTFSATNSFSLGGNTGISVSAPSGGGGGGRIIGG